MGECLIMRRGGETYKLPVLDASYPKDVTTTVIKGNTTSATFIAQISEAGNPATYTYQWYVNGSKVSGATSSSYTKSDLSTTATYSVYCEITNNAGTVQTRVATLKVTQHYTPVLNTSYPANASNVNVGAGTTFKVAIATAGVPASYTYQWYVNGSAVSGATSSSMTYTFTAIGSYTVYCKVTNSAGTVQSRTATVTVTMHLYNSGNECTSVTGGWSAYAVPTNSDATGGTRTITKGTTSMSIAPHAQRGGIVRTVNKVNITSAMKSLVFNGTLYSDSNKNSEFWCSICVWSAIGSYANQNVVACFHQGTGDAFTGTKTIDVSSLNGTYYVGFSLYGLSELSVTSLQLK